MPMLLFLPRNIQTLEQRFSFNTFQNPSCTHLITSFQDSPTPNKPKSNPGQTPNRTVNHHNTTQQSEQPPISSPSQSQTSSYLSQMKTKTQMERFSVSRRGSSRIDSWNR
ncbi:hypothetical protein Droror1_Dr00024535 [Drosera rotundifolia]